MTVSGRASGKGTERYRERFAADVNEQHFRAVGDLSFSSIGIGTYLGKWDRETDTGYSESVKRAVDLGCNVIDTAANYRFQRSERSIGAALADLFAAGIHRDELVVCTKGGYLPFDGTPPGNVRAYIEETFVRPGIVEASDIVGGSHCMTPAYLQTQIDQSRKNLNLECLDVYYLHNPESQVGAVSAVDFASRLRAAFALFEQNIADGKIASYGVATWNGFRAIDGGPGYHSLEQMATIAREVAGDRHGFGFIQLPYNLSMPEALVLPNQPVGGEEMSTLEAALELGITAIASGTILQGKLSQGLPADLKQKLAPGGTDAAAAIQFTRSAPGVTTALVGMSHVGHVEENMRLAAVTPLGASEYAGLFGGDD